MELRLYQKDAVEAVYRHLREKDNNPVVVIPTGGGKTPVLATIIHDAIDRWNGRVLLLTHVKELLLQAEEKLRMIAGDIDLGVYSAGLNRKEPGHKCVLAGIQSAYRMAGTLGKFDLVIVDEAHLIPPDGTGMYQTLLGDLKKINPILRVIGLTATPYRTTTGMICTEEGILNEICYEISVRTLIELNYLCPLRTHAADSEVETDHIRIKNGEFDAEEVERTMRSGDNVSRACTEIQNAARDRHSVLIFCSGLDHAADVLNALKKTGTRVEGIFGDTLPSFRAQFIQEFKEGKIKYLINVGVLTTGFDAPNIDCVVMLRPTCSPGLYYQMVGRGLRLSETKKDCLVLDFAGNAMRHGPIDTLAPDSKPGLKREPVARKCPQCKCVAAPKTQVCPECGFVWEQEIKEKRDPGHKGRFDPKAPVLSGEKEKTICHVTRVDYHEHRKRGDPGAPPTVRVEYQVDMLTKFCEWLCPEHIGYARKKFEQWWRKHAPSCELPRDVHETLFLANEGAVLIPETITVETETGKKFPRIVGYTFPEKELPDPADETEEIPF